MRSGAQRAPPAPSQPLVHRVGVGRPVVHDAADVDGLLERHPTGPRDGRHQRGDLERALLGVDVDHLEAGDPLLELLERAVGDHPAAGGVGADDARGIRRGEDRGVDELAALDELGVERAVVVEVGGDLLRLPLLHGGVHDAGLEGDDEQVPGHGWPLPFDGLGARSAAC